MIKTRTACAAVGLMFTLTTAGLAANPHMGTWKLNEAKSKLVPDVGRNTIVTYAAEKEKVTVTAKGTDTDGKPTRSVWVGKFDGKAYPLKGKFSYNSVAYKVVNARTNDITTFNHGKKSWSGRIIISADGKTRTVIVNASGEGGKNFQGKAVYDKIEG